MVRHTIKVAVLEGDTAIDDLVAILYYDLKPIYFLSTVIPDVSWKSCSKRIYSKLENKKVTKSFLCPNFVDLYNYDMNSVDRADHLRMNYNMGVGLRFRKWWFSICWCGIDIAMVNAYLLYKSWMEMHRFPPKLHYQFQEAVALAWMDTDHHWTSRNKRMKQNQVTKTPNKVNNKSGSISFLS